MPLIIPKILFQDMINHCKNELPYETCGILSGKDENVLTRWEFHSPFKFRHRFLIKKDLVHEVLEKVKKKQEDVIGIYHTHPTTDPIPSHVDIKNHPDPNVLMIIVSFRSCEPKVKCYKISKSSYIEYSFIVI